MQLPWVNLSRQKNHHLICHFVEIMKKHIIKIKKIEVVLLNKVKIIKMIFNL